MSSDEPAAGHMWFDCITKSKFVILNPVYNVANGRMWKCIILFHDGSISKFNLKHCSISNWYKIEGARNVIRVV